MPNAMQPFNESAQRVNNLVYWYAFLMAFPAVVVVQNISIYIFPFLLLAAGSLKQRLISIDSFLKILLILFGVGAIISVVNIPDGLPVEYSQRALAVLPNYLYWVLLVLFLSSHASTFDLRKIYSAVFLGTFWSIVYFFFLQHLGALDLPIFKVLSQNAFAFLLICFSPIIVWYTWAKYGMIYSLIALAVLVICGFLSGSRSGSLLVFSGGAATLVLNRKSIGTVALTSVVIFISIISLIGTEPVKQSILELNPRTYDLIYSREQTLQLDRSYLTRLAQIEKATLIFEKFPVSGIGLNNFGEYEINIPGRFKGAELVVSKRDIDRKSAHNSYYGFLAEGGLVLLVPFTAILLYCNIWFVKNFRRIELHYRPIFVGLLHMSIHLYFIYAILNVFAWFLIGLACMVISRSKN